MPEKNNATNNQPPPGNRNQNDEKTKPLWLDVIAACAAILILGAFGFLIFYLVSRSIPAEQTEWNRLTYLFGSVEAIAFTTAGFIFGRQVSREQVDRADKQVNEARKEIDIARGEANDANRRADETQLELIKLKAKKEGLDRSVRLWNERRSGVTPMDAGKQLEQLEKILNEWA